MIKKDDVIKLLEKGATIEYTVWGVLIILGI